jgi:hypothetical protein
MSIFSKTLIVVGLTAGLAGAAYAQAGAGGEPWVLKADMGYMVDKDGKAVIVTLDKTKMAKATAVPKGMMFFMQDGHMMMVDSTR